MTRKEFKKSIFLTAVAVIGLFVLSPLAAGACEAGPVAEKSGEVKIAALGKNAADKNIVNKGREVKNNFCAIFSSAQIKAKEKIADNAGKIEIKRSQNLINLTQKRLSRDTKLAENKMVLEEKVIGNFSKLEKRASTTAEKEAVAAYRAAVSKAISDRREAIKAATDAYRSGLDKAMAERKTAISKATADYNASVKAAYEKAKADCAAGLDEKTIKSNLKTALAAAHGKLVKDRQGIEKLKVDIKPLLEVRQKAMEKIKADFKAAMEKAKADFKAALVKK
jgi:hypothetical protein